MAALTAYSADSSALIHGWRRIYRPRNFSFVWDRLGGLIEEGRLKASIEVYNDLEKKDDELFKWCKERKGKFVVDIDGNIQAHVARSTKFMKAYPRACRHSEGAIWLRPVCDCARGEHPAYNDCRDRGVRRQGAGFRTFAARKRSIIAD